MCQGIRDVANLAWKLDAVLRGGAGEALLDSYGVERKAHVRELTSRIKGIGAVICERDAAKARERDERLLAECGGVVRTRRARTCCRGSKAARCRRGHVRARHALSAAVAAPRRRCAAHGRRARRRLAPVLDLAAGVRDAARAADLRAPLGASTRATACRRLVRPPRLRAALVRPDHYVFGMARGAPPCSAGRRGRCGAAPITNNQGDDTMQRRNLTLALATSAFWPRRAGAQPTPAGPTSR